MTRKSSTYTRIVVARTKSQANDDFSTALEHLSVCPVTVAGWLVDVYAHTIFHIGLDKCSVGICLKNCEPLVDDESHACVYGRHFDYGRVGFEACLVTNNFTFSVDFLGVHPAASNRFAAAGAARVAQPWPTRRGPSKPLPRGGFAGRRPVRCRVVVTFSCSCPSSGHSRFGVDHQSRLYIVMVAAGGLESARSCGCLGRSLVRQGRSDWRVGLLLVDGDLRSNLDVVRRNCVLSPPVLGVAAGVVVGSGSCLWSCVFVVCRAVSKEAILAKELPRFWCSVYPMKTHFVDFGASLSRRVGSFTILYAMHPKTRNLSSLERCPVNAWIGVVVEVGPWATRF
ncbi:hypothetical protein Ae201684_013926 [Aphanomyces euteiches]|uniref:Uncharacterized protein n=1 Tax=Aphanomyces euteiches TaxID=100861 RepID=A0A6G0WLC6_9STRA|nr:hypothetical protein Ae201684_013926 [Aphanomyces euteiches]